MGKRALLKNISNSNTSSSSNSIPKQSGQSNSMVPVQVGNKVVEVDPMTQQILGWMSNGFKTVATEVGGLKAEIEKNGEKIDAVDSYLFSLSERISKLEEKDGIMGDDGETKVAYEVKLSDGSSKLYASSSLAPTGSKPVTVLAKFQYGRPYKKLTAIETLKYQENLEAQKRKRVQAGEKCNCTKAKAYAMMGFEGMVFFEDYSVAKQAAGKTGVIFNAGAVHYYDGIPCEACTEEEKEVDGE